MRRAGSRPASPVSPASPAPPARAAPPRSPAPAAHRTAENKELLRQQLLSASRERGERREHGKPKHARSRQKNRWKLKFHHQALPQEYLDHYEQSLQRACAKQHKKPPEKPKVDSKVDINNLTNETFKMWAQRLAGGPPCAPAPPQHACASGAASRCKPEDRKKNAAVAASKVVTYENLPYMGEMTLNNSKPRRGRKPKKADICHLIYENYGTVVPGRPAPPERPGPGASRPPRGPEAPAGTQKTDLQNKIISSLLERKMSQEHRRQQEAQSPPRLCSPDAPMPEAPRTAAGPLHSDDEPLNLCIRDLHDLKIEIQKKFGNIYSSLPEVKVEADADSFERGSLRIEQPNAISVIQRNTNVVPLTASSSPDLSRQVRAVSPALSEPAQSTVAPDGDDKLPGYVYWPNAGIYMHPLALHTQLLYYQKLAAARARGEQLVTGGGGSPPPRSNSPDEGKKKLVLKQISELLDPKVIKEVEEAKSPDGIKVKRASPNPGQGSVKRKRSAIFIPPMPTKTSTTPTTEVSICKFKFTGGSKPSLQEKKMLSVDSGGNFRYYSGTGNKGIKSYDSVQRETPSGSEASVDTSTLVKMENQRSEVAGAELLNKKKRKSRKTLQREKLEQTFKEKGFLIQTQQLQSAEGATYCKFRQLRKFTRYLFRSWKDYLPGELDERGGGGAPQPHADWG